MNVIRNSRRSNNAVDSSTISSSKLSSPSLSSSLHKINLYHEIPNIEVSLDDFEEFALDRLKVLRMLEQLKLRHVEPSQYKKRLDPLLAKLNDPIKDWISHFVLRLAYCRAEDLRRWFLTQEVALLKWRLNHSAAGSTADALASVLPEAQLVSRKQLEEEELIPLIWAASSSSSSTTTSTTSSTTDGKICKVGFTHALDLVQRRQVLVRRGMAYVPESKLIHLVTARFRTFLSRQLVLASVLSIPNMERTKDFLDNVATVHVLKDQYSSQNQEFLTQLDANNVPSHLKNMPLCMAQLELALRKEKHLKHWARLQYGLFLKGVGLSLDDALVYFERRFAAKGFTKAYAYMWRHMYGKEGKRANWASHSCAKIINGNAPNANEHHGCPFKHTSVQELTQLLTRMGVRPDQQKSILAQKQSEHYNLACLEHFKVMHPKIEQNPNVEVHDLGNHPDAWFRASVAYHNAHAPTKDNHHNIKGGSPNTTAEQPKPIPNEVPSKATTTSVSP